MTALDELIDRYSRVSLFVSDGREDAITTAARQERHELLALIQTLALALARAQGIPLDECEGGLLGEARAVLGKFPTTNRKD
jgi:hypothetical protein